MLAFNGIQLAISLLILLTLISLYQWQRMLIQKSGLLSVVPFADRPHITWNAVFVLICGILTAAQLILRIEAELNPTSHEPSVDAVRSMAILSAGIFLFLLMMLSEFGTISLKQFGISLQNWRADVELGIRGMLIVVLPVLLIRLLTLPMSNGQPEHSLLKLLQSDQGTETLFWIAFSAVILAPLFEELLYRVILQGYLEQRVSPGFAIVFIAVIFSAVHPFPMSLALLPLAIILGYIYHRSHSYIAVVVTHSLFNATNVLLSLLVLEQS